MASESKVAPRKKKKSKKKPVNEVSLELKQLEQNGIHSVNADKLDADGKLIKKKGMRKKKKIKNATKATLKKNMKMKLEPGKFLIY